MKALKRAAVVIGLGSLVSILNLGTAGVAAAQSDLPSWAEISVMGGVHALNENDTALPDNLVNIPAVASVGYHITRVLAVEGEFTWIIPVEQSVDLGSGTSQDLKSADVLAYQGNLRASLPIEGSSWSPYLAAGAGAVTFLSNTDSDRIPTLDKSQTVFATNFGGGVTYGLDPSWALRADFREFVAFPSKDTEGLSANDEADPIWMERGTIGIVYRF